MYMTNKRYTMYKTCCAVIYLILPQKNILKMSNTVKPVHKGCVKKNI